MANLKIIVLGLRELSHTATLHQFVRQCLADSTNQLVLPYVFLYKKKHNKTLGEVETALRNVIGKKILEVAAKYPVRNHYPWNLPTQVDQIVSGLANGSIIIEGVEPLRGHEMEELDKSLLQFGTRDYPNYVSRNPSAAYPVLRGCRGFLDGKLAAPAKRKVMTDDLSVLDLVGAS